MENFTLFGFQQKPLVSKAPVAEKIATDPTTLKINGEVLHATHVYINSKKQKEYFFGRGRFPEFLIDPKKQEAVKIMIYREALEKRIADCRKRSSYRNR